MRGCVRAPQLSRSVRQTRATMLRLLTCFLFVGAALGACATMSSSSDIPAESPPLESTSADPTIPSSSDLEFESPPLGSPCTGTWFTYSVGSFPAAFTGTVVGRYPDGSQRPLEGVTFHVIGSSFAKLPFTTNQSGQFIGEVELSSGQDTHCRDGRVEVTWHLGKAEIVVRSHGCSDQQVVFDAMWRPHAMELICDAQDEQSPAV